MAPFNVEIDDFKKDLSTDNILHENLKIYIF